MKGREAFYELRKLTTLRVPLPSISSISFKDTPFLSTLIPPDPKHLSASLPLPRDEYSSLLLTCILGHLSSVGGPDYSSMSTTHAVVWLEPVLQKRKLGHRRSEQLTSNSTDCLSGGENQGWRFPKSVPFLLNATLLISLFWSLDGTQSVSLFWFYSPGKPAHQSLAAAHKEAASRLGGQGSELKDTPPWHAWESDNTFPVRLGHRRWSVESDHVAPPLPLVFVAMGTVMGCGKKISQNILEAT